MSRLRDLPPLKRPKSELPRGEWIWCIVTIATLTVGAVWILTHLGEQPR